jgi:hypothetical protein
MARLALAVALVFHLALAVLQAAAHPARGRAWTFTDTPPESCLPLPIAARAVDAGVNACPL